VVDTQVLEVESNQQGPAICTCFFSASPLQFQSQVWQLLFVSMKKLVTPGFTVGSVSQQSHVPSERAEI
jgi:hypothetical protein